MDRSPRDGRTFVFASDPDGLNRQWEVVARPGCKAALRQVRDLTLGSQTEGCVADDAAGAVYIGEEDVALRSEETTSELQSLMRSSYAVFCLKKQPSVKMK